MAKKDKNKKKKEELFGEKDVQFITEDEKKKCHVVIHTHALLVGAGNAVPVPGLGFAADVGTMTTMAIALSQIFNDKPLDKNVAISLVTGILKRLLLKYPIRMLAKEASKIIPGLGQVVAPTISIGMIESAGWVLVNQFAKERHENELKEEEKEIEIKKAIKAKDELGAKAEAILQEEIKSGSKPLVITETHNDITGLPKAEALVKEEDIKKPFLTSKVNKSTLGTSGLPTADISIKPSFDFLLDKKEPEVNILGTKSDIVQKINNYQKNLDDTNKKATQSSIKYFAIDKERKLEPTNNFDFSNEKKLSENINNVEPKREKIERLELDVNSSSVNKENNRFGLLNTIERTREIPQSKKSLKLEDDLKSFARQRENI